MCGFNSEDVEKERPRIEKAIQKIGLKEEDFKRAEKRVETYFDIKLKGMRKILGIFLKEFISLLLAREEKKKVIYSMLPSLGGNPAAVVNLVSKDFYAGFPDIIFCFVMGQIFGKLGYILDAAENHALPAGMAHCGSDQLRLGRYLLELTPKPDLHISWGVLCDEAPKLDDMISEYFGIPTVFINNCQDGWIVESGIPRVPERTFQFVGGEVKRAVNKISDVIGIEITDEMMMASLVKTMEYFNYWAEIGLLFKNDPMPLSQVDMLCLHLLILICVQNQDELIDASRILLEELKERVANDIGAVEKGTPKVLIAGVTPIPDPSIARLIEELGVAVSVTELQIFGPNGEPRPDIGEAGDLIKAGPYVTIAKLFATNSVFSGVGPRIDMLQKASNYWDVDAILWYLHSNCRTYSTDALMIKDAMKKATDLPFLFMEGDLYDPRVYNLQQQRVRLETFAEMVKAHRAGKQKK
jgi:benzoyl-CoA reductase/2-hydroxyglutaryl-CoA dehydratase subunit BcrC/BadD/HgdB